MEIVLRGTNKRIAPVRVLLDPFCGGESDRSDVGVSGPFGSMLKGSLRLLQQPPGDDEPHDLGCPLVDLNDFSISH